MSVGDCAELVRNMSNKDVGHVGRRGGRTRGWWGGQRVRVGECCVCFFPSKQRRNVRIGRAQLNIRRTHIPHTTQSGLDAPNIRRTHHTHTSHCEPRIPHARTADNQSPRRRRVAAAHKLNHDRRARVLDLLVDQAPSLVLLHRGGVDAASTQQHHARFKASRGRR